MSSPTLGDASVSTTQNLTLAVLRHKRLVARMATHASDRPCTATDTAADAADVLGYEVDHIVPVINSGTDQPANPRSLCHDCHASR